VFCQQVFRVDEGSPGLTSSSPAGVSPIRKPTCGFNSRIFRKRQREKRLGTGNTAHFKPSLFQAATLIFLRGKAQSQYNTQRENSKICLKSIIISGWHSGPRV
jgi:hypothetical protein